MNLFCKAVSRPVFWTVLLALAVSAVLATISIKRHYNLESDEDLAMFDQMLWNVRNGKGLVTTLSGEADLLFKHHFFGEHVSPILYLLAWPAGLTRGPAAMLILQALVFGLSAIPLARWAGRLFGNLWAGLAAAIFWLLMPNLWLATLYDWHMEALEPLFIFAFILALYRGSKTAWLWAILYAACKEDAPVYLAFVAAIFGWISGRRRLGFAIAGAAVCYALLAWFVIGPACSPSGKHMLVSRAVTPFLCGGWWPWIKIVFFDATRWTALSGHLLSFGFLPLFGGFALLPAAVSVGAAWFSVSLYQYKIMMHYPFTVYPLLMLSAVWGASFFIGRIDAVPVKSFAGLSKVFWRRLFQALFSLAPLIGLLIFWPLSLESIKKRIGTGGKNWAKTDEIFDKLPKDGRWAGLLQLVPHCARRDNITVIMSPMDADWLVVKLHGRPYTFSENEYRRWLTGLLGQESSYGVYCMVNSTVAVLKRFYITDANPKALSELLWVMEEDDVLHNAGKAVQDNEALNGRSWSSSGGERGFVWWGGYRNLPPGKYRAKFRLRTTAGGNHPVARLDVTEEGGKSVRGEMEICGDTGKYVWKIVEVNLSGTGKAECRCFKTGRGTLLIDRVEWEPIDGIQMDNNLAARFFGE